MRNNRLFIWIVAIRAIVLAIGLTIKVGAAAPQVTTIEEAPPGNLHDPRPIEAPHALLALDVEQARLNWKESAPAAAGQNFSGNPLDRQTRDAIQARWLARYGSTNRTCVLLCGGW